MTTTTRLPHQNVSKGLSQTLQKPSGLASQTTTPGASENAHGDSNENMYIGVS